MVAQSAVALLTSETGVATLALLAITASFPFYIYGAWVMLDADTRSWSVLTYHLKFIVVGLTLNTVPVVGWMMPRLPNQFGGLAVLHAVLGLQAYAMLVFALTGIVRIFQAKHRANLYRDPDPDADLDELHEQMPHWRRRLRVGVFGYVLFWIGAYGLGVLRYLLRYVL
ncbi:hypothetical protein ACFQE1_17345 [Halobium palmae]|uniref:DUF7321 domain-containing protein n=1 Tax=Halobium palmae TaxID=1776492 RepID=A0ABD5S4Z9_9EURY